MIRRLLIANRGEIAVRIARGARAYGAVPLGVYSDADERALFRDAMEASVRIGPGPANESYLDITAIVAAARELDADAVHPGYGFLSEQAAFAQAVIDAGMLFVGPSPGAIAAMGSKSEAKERVRAAGVPVLPGYDGADQSAEGLQREAAAIGVPLVIKAIAGGGGRGMRVVEDLTTFGDALDAARREALSAFGNGDVLLERFVRRPRHIEFQILGDAHGTIVQIGERECSIQRRHQKVVEEAPAPGLDPELRARMGDAAIAAARSVNYTNAGTVEFLLDKDGTFAFLEMNARLQVEHPVTEAVYGIDLVHEQLRLAAGEPLHVTQAAIAPHGWSIEVRLNAEDPARDFAPQAGTITAFDRPHGEGVRVDTGVGAGSDVPIYYDSLLAKIIVWGTDRAQAIRRLQLALAQTRLTGIATNLPMLRGIAGDAGFAAGALSTQYLDERTETFSARQDVREGAAWMYAVAALASAGASWRASGTGVPIVLDRDGRRLAVILDRIGGGWRIRDEFANAFAVEPGPPMTVVLPDRSITGDAAIDAGGITVTIAGLPYRFTFPPPPDARPRAGKVALGSGSLVAPMPGKIVAVNAAAGAKVAAHDVLIVLEAMKMEHRIVAPLAGTLSAVHVSPGDIVAAGTLLATIEA